MIADITLTCGSGLNLKVKDRKDTISSNTKRLLTQEWEHKKLELC